MAKAELVLRPSMSKRLIARGVKKLLEGMGVLDRGIVYIARGSTCAYVVEELIDRKIEKERYLAGFIGEGILNVLPREKRLPPFILINGRLTERNPEEVARKMSKGDVFIKGGNAIDPEGNVGVLVANREGGTVGKYIGIMLSRGVTWISPISIGKLIPDVIEASCFAKTDTFDYSVGKPSGLFPLVNIKAVTEMDAFKILFDVESILIAKEGLWEDEGSIVIGIEGEEKKVEEALKFIVHIKGEELPKPKL